MQVCWWESGESPIPRGRYVTQSVVPGMHNTADAIPFIFSQICLPLHSSLHPSSLGDKFYLSVQCCVTGGPPTLTRPYPEAGKSHSHFSGSHPAPPAQYSLFLQQNSRIVLLAWKPITTEFASVSIFRHWNQFDAEKKFISSVKSLKSKQKIEFKCRLTSLFQHRP